jgi:hypothetical protein
LPATHLTSTLAIAEGQVDPAPRVLSGEIRQERIDELRSRIRSGEFTTQIGQNLIPCDCMDCRPQTNGQMVIGPKAAGGTTTLVIADALTTNSYRHPGEKAPAHKERLFTRLIEKEHKVGGHIADNVNLPGYAGCGAEDKLDSQDPSMPSILGFIGRKSQQLFSFVRQAGYDISPDLENDITAKAATLREEHYATNGVELSQAGKAVAGEDNIKVLTDEQRGVVIVVLTNPGDVLDQQAIADEFGPDYQVFEIAAWAIANGARAISATEEEAHAKTIAGVLYSVAAGGVIAGPGMPVDVI